MKHLFKVLLAASALGLTIGSVAHASPSSHCNKVQGHQSKIEKKGHRDMSILHANKPRFLRGIKLTDKQEDEVFKLTHAEAPKMRDRIKKQRALRQELVVLIQSEQFNDQQAQKIANKLASLEKDSALAKARIDGKIMSLLTQEQREQVIQNRKQRETSYKNSRFKPTSHQIKKQPRIAI